MSIENPTLDIATHPIKEGWQLGLILTLPIQPFFETSNMRESLPGLVPYETLTIPPFTIPLPTPLCILLVLVVIEPLDAEIACPPYRVGYRFGGKHQVAIFRLQLSDHHGNFAEYCDAEQPLYIVQEQKRKA